MIAPPNTQELHRFQTRIVELLGLHFEESGFANLGKILQRRLLVLGGSYAQYLDNLCGVRAGEEIACLARDLTITETYFLRHIEQFNAYANIALSQRASAIDPGQRLQILSAGCASGEEAYSLAITAREHFPALAPGIAVTAVDVNTAMLQKAAQGHYTNWSLRECPQALKTRWFTTRGDVFILDESIRQAVKFEPRNLTQDDAQFWRAGRFDIVFCRNVLMYFSRAQMQASINRIACAMAPGGYLFLGHAETLRGISNDFHLCHSHGTFYYQRKERLSVPADTVSAEQSHARPAPMHWVTAIEQASERIQALIPSKKMPALVLASPAVRPPADLHRALEFLHNEQFDLTLEQIGGLPEQHAKDPDVLLLKAVSLSHCGTLAQAEAVCQELLQRDALSAGAHYVLALCREGVGDAEGAIEHDQAAIYLDPEFAMPRLHIGLLARRRGDLQGAHRDLNAALILLQKEDASRVLLFGGGFKREALIGLCRAELLALGELP